MFLVCVMQYNSSGDDDSLHKTDNHQALVISQICWAQMEEIEKKAAAFQ